MWRLVNYSLFFLCLLGFPGANPSFSQENNGQKDKNKTAASICGLNTDLLETWQSMSVIPVQFIEKNKENTILKGVFSSKLFHQSMTFTLAPEVKSSFYMIDDDWEEEVDQKKFFKNFKKDGWLLVYLPSRDNAICEAHQFKNWPSIEASFGEDPNSVVKSVHDIAFWRRLKGKPIMFVEVAQNQAYWLFVSVTDEPPKNEDEYVNLKNGMRARKKLRGGNGVYGEILDHGAFTISSGCVFHRIETKVPRVKIGGYSLLGSARSRPVPVDRSYFVDRITQSYWLCFYDEETSNLIRVIEMITDESAKKNGSPRSGSGGAGNGKNSKNGKNGKNLKQ